MKTALLLVTVAVLQAAFMVVVYGTHVFGLQNSGLFGLAVWLVLPTGAAGFTHARVLTRSQWIMRSSHRAIWFVGASSLFSLLVLYAGAFVSINTFGE
jgi:hypothetical protein